MTTHEAVLRVHHGQPIASAVHRSDEQLRARVQQHKTKLVPGFTSRYDVTRLVYAEQTDDVRAAIGREKQIKGWLRAKKIALIESENPEWRDLSDDW